MSARVFRYSNAGQPLGALAYVSGTHEEALDGTDKLTVMCRAEPSKRERLVWQDASGVWREHMVDSAVRSHGAGRPLTEATCSNSVNELYGVEATGGKREAKVSAHLAQLLQGTRWSVGACSDFPIVELETFHKNVRQCIAELCELVGGELETVVEVGNVGVVKRSVAIVRQKGRTAASRQFTYGRNVADVKREVGADEVYTAVVGYGEKAELVQLESMDTSKMSDSEREAHQERVRQVREDDYAPRIRVVAEPSASDLSAMGYGSMGDYLRAWGVPTGSGFAHNFMTYTDGSCTDAAFLKKQCERHLRTVMRPLVRYEFEVAEADESLWGDVRLGDRVSCVDEAFDPPIGMVERVSYVRRSLSGRMECRVAIGERSNPLVQSFKAQEKSTPNTTRANSDTPRSSSGATSFDGGGGYGGYSGGDGGSAGGGDGWVHQVDGVTQATGTINFVTVGSSEGGTINGVAGADAWGSDIYDVKDDVSDAVRDILGGDGWGGSGDGSSSGGGGS